METMKKYFLKASSCGFLVWPGAVSVNKKLLCTRVISPGSSHHAIFFLGDVLACWPHLFFSSRLFATVRESVKRQAAGPCKAQRRRGSSPERAPHQHGGPARSSRHRGPWSKQRAGRRRWGDSTTGAASRYRRQRIRVSNQFSTHLTGTVLAGRAGTGCEMPSMSPVQAQIGTDVDRGTGQDAAKKNNRNLHTPAEKKALALR